jgi:molybdopterin synthase sulfur carrier subunit
MLFMRRRIEPALRRRKQLRGVVVDLNATAMNTKTIRVELPAHLRTLANISGHEVRLQVAGEPTVRAVLDALEAEFPMLDGTIRDHVTRERRAFLRFFACMQDISFDPMDAPLPGALVDGREPLIILGAVAGGRCGAGT